MELAVLLTLQLPKGMSAAEACAEIRRSVEFGQPQLQVIYVMEKRPDDEPDS